MMCGRGVRVCVSLCVCVFVKIKEERKVCLRGQGQFCTHDQGFLILIFFISVFFCLYIWMSWWWQRLCGYFCQTGSHGHSTGSRKTFQKPLGYVYVHVVVWMLDVIKRLRSSTQREIGTTDFRICVARQQASGQGLFSSCRDSWFCWIVL